MNQSKGEMQLLYVNFVDLHYIVNCHNDMIVEIIGGVVFY